MPVVAVLVLLITGCGSAAEVNGRAATEPSSTVATAGDGLTCTSDVRNSAIYEYGSDPEPHGATPDVAVEEFFGDRLPEGAELTVEGSQVTVVTDQAAVASIGLMSVTDGYVVSRYEACEDVLA